MLIHCMVLVVGPLLAYVHLASIHLPDLIHMIKAPSLPFFTILLLLCIILNVNGRAKSGRGLETSLVCTVVHS